MKYLVRVGLLFAMLVFEVVNTIPVEAKALRRCPHGGYCLPGTCTRFTPGDRVQYACNVANCSAANCGR